MSTRGWCCVAFRALVLVGLGVLAIELAADDVGRRIDLLGSGPEPRETVEPQPSSIGVVDIDDRLQAQPSGIRPDNQGEQTLGDAGSVFVRELRVLGCTAFTESELDIVVSQYEGREVSFEELQELRLALSKMYLESGYINSGVVIPNQSVDDGVVILRAIEGSLSRVDLMGDPRLAKAYITSRLDRYVDRPLNLGDLQAGLQHLERDRNVDRLDARLAPGDGLGESVLQLAIEEPPQIELALSGDNHSSSSVGAERGRLSLTTRNVTGFGETLSATGALSEGSNDLSAAVDVPLGRWNTAVQAYYSTSDGKIVEDAFKVLDIRSNTDTSGLMLTHPFIDGLRNTASIVVGFETKKSKSELAGVPFSFSPGAIDGKSETSVAQLGLDWTGRGNNHVVAVRGTWRRGLDTWGATEFDPADELAALANPTGADGQFDMVLAQGLFLYRLQSLPGLSGMHERGQLLVRLTTQLADDPLMSLEKIAMGGASTVRGYPENLLVRDNGVATTIELQLPVSGYREAPHWRSLLIAPFVDYGRSWDDRNVDSLSATRDTSETRYLVGAGIGVIWQPLRGLFAQVYWGADVADNFNGDDPRDADTGNDDLQDDGVHFNVSYTVEF